MLKFSRRNKKLVIPVGINPNYNIEVKDLYTTKDADVVAGDIIAGKIAYGSDGKIIGSLDLDNEKENSYNEGVADGYISGKAQGKIEGIEEGIVIQKDQLISIEITENGTYNREDGYNEVVVNVPDLNGSYDEGYSDGVVAGREEIITEQSDATITPQTVFKGEIGYGKDNERIVGEFEFVEGFDFSSIGYNQEDSNNANRNLSDAIAYSKTLQDEWNSGKRTSFSGKLYMLFAPYVEGITTMNQFFNTNYALTAVPLLDTSKVTMMYRAFYQCYSLPSVPLFDTSNVTDMGGMFYYCLSLTSVPQFDTSNVTNMSNMFKYCSSLTSVPQFNTSKVTNMSYMFSECTSLTSVPQFDTSNVTNMYEMFPYCTSLTSVPLLNCEKVNSCTNAFINCNNLVDVAGFTNLGKGFGTDYNVFSFRNCNKLTRQSCLNIFNTIYDMNLNENATAAKIIELPATVKALLSNEDIAIATSKGWTIS